jgi:predicted RNA-binding Zn ribbon-like protein
MKPLFLGSHPAMDFFNTTLAPQGSAIELIGDGKSFAEWLVGAGLLGASDVSKLKRRLGDKALDAAAAKARLARQWMTEWVSRWRESPHAHYDAELRRLNGLLAHAKCYRQLLRSKGGLQVLERCNFDTADELVALVAAQVASLVASERPELVKRCAGPQCTLWFLDRTKAHRRVFCSPQVCGNRAKVAAFRERQRTA